MNRKKWSVVVIALILVVTSLVSSIGLQKNQEEASRMFTDYFNQTSTEKVVEEGVGTDRILKLNIEGAISGAEVDYSQETVLDAVEQIEEDESIKAVLINLDTPGGTVYETREVYDLFQKVTAERDIPVYASMKATAASGGYYLAMLADEIYATPETLTGSIGVIASFYNIEGLEEKVGLEPKVLKSGDLKDMGSSSREMTEEEEEVFQNYIDESFNRFVQVVVDGRQLPEEEVRRLADGRIYTAQQAVDNQLIDGIAYEREVIDQIKADIGVENPEIFTRVSSNPFASSLPFSLSSLVDNLGQSELEKTVNELEDLSELKIEYRWEG